MEFVSPDPTAMVRAANVKATLDAFDLVPSLGKKIAENHKLKPEEMKEDAFLPVQRWLNALKEIQEKVGSVLVRQVGNKIIANAHFPPQLSSVEAVLEALDNIYYMNHRGNVGHYRTSRKPDGSIEVRCETCYPRQFEYGLIEGICQNKGLTQGKSYLVKYTEGPPGSDLTCTLTVKQR